MPERRPPIVSVHCSMGGQAGLHQPRSKPTEFLALASRTEFLRGFGSLASQQEVTAMEGGAGFLAMAPRSGLETHDLAQVGATDGALEGSQKGSFAERTAGHDSFSVT